MRVYLDNCCYNRPFDDQTQLRVRQHGLTRVANPVEFAVEVQNAN